MHLYFTAGMIQSEKCCLMVLCYMFFICSNLSFVMFSFNPFSAVIIIGDIKYSELLKHSNLLMPMDIPSISSILSLNMIIIFLWFKERFWTSLYLVTGKIILYYTFRAVWKRGCLICISKLWDVNCLQYWKSQFSHIQECLLTFFIMYMHSADVTKFRESADYFTSFTVSNQSEVLSPIQRATCCSW